MDSITPDLSKRGEFTPCPNDNRHRESNFGNQAQANAQADALAVCEEFCILYLAVCLVFSILQTKLIFPGTWTQGHKSSVYRPGTK